MPVEKREAVDWLKEEKGLSTLRACRAIKLGRSAWYRPPLDRNERDAPVIDKLNEVLGKPQRARWGFWACYHWIRQQGHVWNHKRVYRVYRKMGLNQPRRTKRRLPERVKQPLNVPAEAGTMWAMDFMHDTLVHGKSFRTLNVMDEGVREILAIEVDTSLPAARVVRVLEQLKDSYALPQQIRVDNGPELISTKLVEWCEQHEVILHHIQPGKPTQNAYIERFNRTFRREVLNATLFSSLDQVRETVHEWMITYNEERPHSALGNLPPAVFRRQLTPQPTDQNSTLELSA